MQIEFEIDIKSEKWKRDRLLAHSALEGSAGLVAGNQHFRKANGKIMLLGTNVNQAYRTGKQTLEKGAGKCGR